MAVLFPLNSPITSAPRPLVSSNTLAITSSFKGLITTSAPSSLAKFNLYSFTSTAIIFLAPYAFDTFTPISPIGPHPTTTTSFPLTGKCAIVCTALPRGS